MYAAQGGSWKQAIAFFEAFYERVGIMAVMALQKTDYMEINARQALKSVGYVLLPMPKFDLAYLGNCREKDDHRWKPILPQSMKSQELTDSNFYNARDLGKRLQRNVVIKKEEVRKPYRQWRQRYNLGKLELYRAALLRSMPNCHRQYFHCDTHELDALRDTPFEQYYLGVVCAPFQMARLHIK
jgi:hypothetical protein